MNNENNWSVYCHTNKTNNKKYIGITCKKPHRRWSNGNGYKGQMFYKAIQKYGWENFKHEILFENLTLEKAIQKEIELILKYNSSNWKYGYNISKGGASSCKRTDETKRKISLSRKGKYFGKNNPMFGIKHSEESINKMKESLSKIDRTTIKQRSSEENSVSVVQLNKKGEVLKEWRSIKEASENCNISTKSIIDYCKGNTKHVRGDNIWIYKECFEKMDEDDVSKLIKKLSIPMHSVPIVQLTIDGDFVKIWDSSTTASNELFKGTNSSKTCITMCCLKRIKTSFGYKWIYLEEYENSTKEEIVKEAQLNKINKNSNKILQFTLLGIFIKEWESTSQIEYELKIKKYNIRRACHETSKSFNGYIWLKKDDYEKNPNILKEKVNI